MFIFPIEGKDPEDAEPLNPNEKRNLYIFLFVLFLFIAALFWIFVLT